MAKSRRVRTRNKQNGRVTIAVGGCSNHNAENTPPEPGRTYQYDPKSRLKSVNNGSVAAYQYDGNGRRAVKNTASGTRLYFYDIAGRPVAESGPTGVWLSGHAYFQNRHAFENTGSQLLWRHPDHLGTAVVRTNTDGNKICDSRFYPYGEEFTPPCAGDPYKFTGKERDAETGLDYFGARHYGSYLGRFVSPDEPFADQYEDDPQSWNLYGYVRNNPVKFIDPTGRACVKLDDGSIGDDGRGVECPDVPKEDFSITVEYQRTRSMLLMDAAISGARLAEGPTNLFAAGLMAFGGARAAIFAADYLSGTALINLGVSAAPAIPATNSAAKFDWSRADHIFRNADGHVAAFTRASQQRWATLFEKVASQNANRIANPHKESFGVHVYRQTFRNGKQVWVEVRDGVIQNAGVNSPGTRQ